MKPTGKTFSLLVWPHLDNTFTAFVYFADGRVEVNTAVPDKIQKLASAIREMAGILRSPAKARKYSALGIAYDGASKREEQWEERSQSMRTH